MARRRTAGRAKSGASGLLIALVVAVVVVLGVVFIFVSGEEERKPTKRSRATRRASEGTDPTPKEEVLIAQPGAQSGTGGTGRKQPGAQSGTGGAGRKQPGAQSGTGGAGRKQPGAQSGTGGTGRKQPGAEAVRASAAPESAGAAPVTAAPVAEPAPAGSEPPPAGRPFRVKEPASVSALTPRAPERSRWSWNAAHAEPTPTGDLKWKPKKFEFRPGKVVRCIDYERGNDDNAGTGRTRAWKHHPWDPNAKGKAKSSRGAVTYVFKRGVVYRGRLVCNEAGTPGEPIQLTSDPGWGRGEAVICGSERVTSWKRGAPHDDIPAAAKVWYADLDWLARNAWAVDERGNVVRLNLARTPNWKVSDPEDVMSEWWTWEQPAWWEDNCSKWKVDFKGHRAHLGIDTKHLTQSADAYVGAALRTEYGWVMGTPFPTRVEGYDAAKKGIYFQGIWFGDSEMITSKMRYYLEDKPQYLDSPGEFWVEPKGAGCRIYARMPGDAPPKSFSVEVARHFNLIQDLASEERPVRLDILSAEAKAQLVTQGLKHVRVSGLTFRFTNTVLDLAHPQWMHRDVDNAAIRLYGSSDEAHVSHCRFEHVAKAVHVTGIDHRTNIGRVVVSDNDIQYIDHGAITVGKSGGKLQDVSILRNRLYMVGLRPYRQSHGHALCVNWADELEVAGNILDRCYGAGLFLFGGKGSGQTGEVPLCRMVVQGNKATNTLLAANDWGGIETWQGGPCYVYNNISGNANGYWNWAYSKDKPASARLGFAYYLDGAFKNYHFNNIAWGISNELTSKHCSHTAFYHAVPTILNTFFSNTAYLFAQGSAWSPAGGRQYYLGNIYSDISLTVFAHGKQKEDASAVYRKYPLETIAYGRNVFHNVPEKLGLLEGTGAGEVSLEGLRGVASDKKLLAADVGTLLQESPFRDGAKHDFRLKPQSAAIDGGVKVFVPWGLYAMVGEWNFRRNNADPSVVLDDHWYMTDYVVNRDDYRRCPVFNLQAVNVTADDYERGELEDWTDGALKFNGEDQYARIGHDQMTATYTYKVGKGTRSVSGSQIACPDVGTTNMLIELYFRTEPGHTEGVVVSKKGDSGYELAVNSSGSVTLTLRARGAKAEATCGARINDGKYHHVIAEVDRGASRATIYVDGVTASEERIDLAQGASLANGAPLTVGKGADGHHFAGAIDFLRICRGTLADARTTIEELYDWQFDGPFLRDFAGREVSGERRDAGALERAQRSLGLAP